MRNRRSDRREDRKEERATFGRRGTATRYKMRQKIFALGQDFFIENEQGQKAFKVDGKVLRVRADVAGHDQQARRVRFRPDQLQAGAVFASWSLVDISEVATQVINTEQLITAMYRDPALAQARWNDMHDHGASAL